MEDIINKITSRDKDVRPTGQASTDQLLSTITDQQPLWTLQYKNKNINTYKVEGTFPFTVYSDTLKTDRQRNIQETLERAKIETPELVSSISGLNIVLFSSQGSSIRSYYSSGDDGRSYILIDYEKTKNSAVLSHELSHLVLDGRGRHNSQIIHEMSPFFLGSLYASQKDLYNISVNPNTALDKILSEGRKDLDKVAKYSREKGEAPPLTGDKFATFWTEMHGIRNVNQVEINYVTAAALTLALQKRGFGHKDFVKLYDAAVRLQKESNGTKQINDLELLSKSLSNGLGMNDEEVSKLLTEVETKIYG